MSAAQVESAVIDAAAVAGFVLDPAQQALLSDLAAFVVADHVPPADLGWYVHGPAGRGKTWLLRAVFDAVPVPEAAKRRVHFHTFFRDLQVQFGVHASARSAIAATVEALLDDASWFLFDELHIHDPAAGALLNTLLAGIVERRIPTLVTSNYAPGELLPNPVYRHVFGPGLALIEAHFRVASIDGGADYRQRRRASVDGFGSGRWLVGDGASSGLVAPSPDEARTVASGHHEFRAHAVRGDEVWFDFADLLEAMTTAQDFVAWAAVYRRWVVTGVPPLASASPQARLRLVWLVDVLSDADLPLTVVSSVTREQFAVLADGVPPDLFRTTSRLALLGDGVSR